MKTFKKIYVEITNKCNLSCSFCPGTKRPGKFLDTAEFSHILKEIKPHTDFVYFHLMGEPLLHPHFFEFVDITAAEGLKVCITTNGTLIKKNEAQLLQRLAGSSAGCADNSAPTDNSAKYNSNPIHKISISIQAMEANGVRDNATLSVDGIASNGTLAKQNNATYDFSNYLQDCFAFGKLAEGKTIIAYRLWNEGGENKDNGAIIELMHQYFPQEWVKDHNSYAIGNRIFLELGEKFDWPSPDADYVYSNSFCNGSEKTELDNNENISKKCVTTNMNSNKNVLGIKEENIFHADQKREKQKEYYCTQKEKFYCYALKDQIGILSNGTVVPCCLDAEGQLSLGNIFETPLSKIIESPRAVSIKEAFKNRSAAEDLCKRCGYASRFSK